MSNDSYLGASDAQQIYPENTVDFIQIVDPLVLQYTLSQDVPGAYEGNVLVVQNGNVLQPERDYAIDNGGTINNLITFHVALTLGESIYVVHKGIATYNLVPSPRSVTDDSLSENLRNFIFETFSGDTVIQEWPLVKQELGDYVSRSLLVTVDGAVKRPYVGTLPPTGTWDYYVDQVDENTSKIVFQSPPAAGTNNVCVLHLAFSTVLRRSDYLTSISIAPGAILKNHIANDAVDGTKILLNNNQNIRGKDFAGSGTVDIIKVNVSDQVEIKDTVIVDSTKITTTVTNTIDIGEDTKRIKKIYATDIDVSGAVTAGDIDASGDATVDGTLTVGDLIVNGGSLIVTDPVPVGAVMPYYGTDAFPTVAPYNKYLICDGQAIPAGVEYATLRTRLGITVLPGNVPDLQQRIPLGKGVTPGVPGTENVGTAGGNFTHTHSIVSHGHTISTPPGVVDAGHSHGSSYQVAVPSHTHFLNEHRHNLQTHKHPYKYTHTHNIAIWSGSNNNNHNHSLYHRNDGAIGGSNKFLVNAVTSNIMQTGLANNSHTHFINGTTSVESSSINEDWGYTHGIDNGYKLTENNEEPFQTTDTFSYTNPYNRTRYNHSIEGTDPGNMTAQTDKTVNVTGTSSSSASGITLATTASTDTTPLTTGNSVLSQPYLVCNFIIRAIP